MQARIGSGLVNDGELLGRAEDFFPDDPDVRLVFEFDDVDFDEQGAIVTTRLTSTDRLLPPEEDSPVRIIESVEEEETWQTEYSLEDGLRIFSEVSETGRFFVEGGALELPAELRAGAFHQALHREHGEEEFGGYEAFSRVVIRIVGLEDLETPAGTFEDVLRVERKSRSVDVDEEAIVPDVYTLDETLWFAKGLGVIRSVTRMDGIEQESVLTEVRR